MGSKNGSWQRKLQDKAKRVAMQQKLGNEKGVMARGGTVAHSHATAMLNDRRPSLRIGKCADATIEPKGDKPVHPVKTIRDYDLALPRKAGYVIRPFKRKGHSGCVMSRGRRAAIAAHDARLNAQVNALILQQVKQ